MTEPKRNPRLPKPPLPTFTGPDDPLPPMIIGPGPDEPYKLSSFAGQGPRNPKDFWNSMIGSHGTYDVAGPGINDQRNTQNYRYEWVEDQIKNAEEEARIEIQSIRASFQAGEITRSQSRDKQIQVAEHRNMIKRRMNHVKEQGYDVPWYIDAANLGGLLSGDMHKVAKDRRTIWDEYND